MKPSVYILGSGGFIGSNITSRLQADGHRVGVGTFSAFSGKPKSPEEFAEIVNTFDWVIHAATASTPSSSAGSPLSELEDNLRTTLSLAQALQARPDCRLIYLSSAGTLYGETADGNVPEESAIEPRSYHGAGKVAAEHFLRALAAQFRNRVVVLRPSNVYGPGQSPRPGFGIVPTAFSRCLDGQPLTIWGDGRNVRDYLYVDDLTDLVVRVVCSDNSRKFSIINAASGKGHSLIELLDAVQSVSGTSIKLDFQPARSTDAVRVVPDRSLASKLYGWTPRTELLEGLERTFEWIQRDSKITSR